MLGRPRKKLRKGTHSCAECRRRKARCVYSTESASDCDGCLARGTSCSSQEYEEESNDNRKNVRERLGLLENTVKHILQRLENSKSGVDEGRSEAARALETLSGEISGLVSTQTSLLSDSPSKTAGPYENAPMQSLFNNAVIRREEPAIEPDMGVDTASRHDRRCQELKALLPSQRAMNAIFESTSQWWAGWKFWFPRFIAEYGDVSLKDFASKARATQSLLPLCQVLLCLAVSIQQLPPEYDTRRVKLPHSPEILMERLVSTVDRLVLTDEQVSNSLDGIETMILQSNFYINIGQPRKAYLTTRRAISFAHLLGLQHSFSNGSSGNISALTRRKRSLWFFLYFCDRHVSFLLGMPYNIFDAHCGLDFSNKDWSPIEHYLSRLSRASGHLIDRIQEQQHGKAVTSATFDLALQLDQELDELANSTPASWWQPEGSVGAVSEGMNTLVLMAQIWHHHVRALNHLPFMLQSGANRRYEHSLLACVQAAREMIRIYPVLRSGHGDGSGFSCKMVDFQAFTASVLVLLNLLGYGHTSAALRDDDQERRDWAMVDNMVAHLRNAAREFGGVVASQGLQALEKLMAGRAGGLTRGSRVKLMIPYFGTITIGAVVPAAPATPTAPAPPQVARPAPPASSSYSSDLPYEIDPNTAPDQDLGISFTSLFAADAEDQLFQGLGGPWQNTDLDQDWSWILDGSHPL